MITSSFGGSLDAVEHGLDGFAVRVGAARVQVRKRLVQQRNLVGHVSATV